MRSRPDGPERFDELFALLQDHAAAGSVLAGRLVLSERLAAETWVVEPVAPAAAVLDTSALASMPEVAIPLRT
jgi:hypothetical protein